MATIYLDNLIKPRQVSSSDTIPEILQSKDIKYTYTDLHLDIETSFNIHASSRSNQNDIRVDYDVQAVRNSIRNLMTTRPLSKIYSPAMGSKLETYLFEGMSEFKASLIGREINTLLTKYEPRINITSIIVFPDIKANTYNIRLEYSLVDKNLIDTLEILLEAKTVNSTIIVSPHSKY